MADKVADLDTFRSGLEDLVIVLNALAPICDKTSDLIAVLKLAIENDGQSRLLMKAIASSNKK